MSVRTSNSQSLVSLFGGQSSEILLWLRRPQQEDCEKAYFKMDNVLIDDRRIHVDFSQSVSKIRWKGKGADRPSASCSRWPSLPVGAADHFLSLQAGSTPRKTSTPTRRTWRSAPSWPSRTTSSPNRSILLLQWSAGPAGLAGLAWRLCLP